MRYRITSQTEIDDIGGTIVATKKNGDAMVLNEMAGVILSALSVYGNKEGAEKFLFSRYDVSEIRLEADIQRMIEEFLKYGIMEEIR